MAVRKLSSIYPQPQTLLVLKSTMPQSHRNHRFSSQRQEYPASQTISGPVHKHSISFFLLQLSPAVHGSASSCIPMCLESLLPETEWPYSCLKLQRNAFLSLILYVDRHLAHFSLSLLQTKPKGIACVGVGDMTQLENTCLTCMMLWVQSPA